MQTKEGLILMNNKTKKVLLTIGIISTTLLILFIGFWTYVGVGMIQWSIANQGHSSYLEVLPLIMIIICLIILDIYLIIAKIRKHTFK